MKMERRFYSQIPSQIPPQGTRKGYPYHGPTRIQSQFVHGRGILEGYPAVQGLWFYGVAQTFFWNTFNFLVRRQP